MASSVNNPTVIESVRLNIVIADPSRACSQCELLQKKRKKKWRFFRCEKYTFCSSVRFSADPKYAEELSHRSSPPPWTSNGSLSCFYFLFFPPLSQAQASDSRRTVTAPVSAALQTLPASHGTSSTLSGVEDGSEVELMRWQAASTETPWRRSSSASSLQTSHRHGRF